MMCRGMLSRSFLPLRPSSLLPALPPAFHPSSSYQSLSSSFFPQVWFWNSCGLGGRGIRYSLTLFLGTMTQPSTGPGVQSSGTAGFCSCAHWALSSFEQLPCEPRVRRTLVRELRTLALLLRPNHWKHIHQPTLPPNKQMPGLREDLKLCGFSSKPHFLVTYFISFNTETNSPQTCQKP